MEWDRVRTLSAILISANSKTGITPRKFKPLRILDKLYDIEHQKDEDQREEEYRKLREFSEKLKAKEAKK